MNEKKPFQLYLTKEDKDKLEEIRKKRGLRSWADTIRQLIKGE
ncbi:MAG: ribbon-helix-helix protein, CopG family [Nanoarchaeota archaeon]|nr:ribbon-helix-helix protein, CopG family [Nanoarchaeota archaeon]